MKEHTTWNYILSFQGWAQCRMATDPDPSNDPRGVSGYSFALPGEPDFSQIVYFQKCGHVHRRSHCPDIGVRVTGGKFYRAKVTTDDVQGVTEDLEEFLSEPQTIDSKNPLYHAEVDLLNDPIFDSRNSTIVYDGYGLLSPFDFEVRSCSTSEQKISIQRSFYVDPKCPETDMESIPIDDLTPHIMSTAVYDAGDASLSSPGSPDILLESGILQPTAYRKKRLDLLQKDLNSTTDRIQCAALKKRIAELQIDDPQNRRSAQLGAKVLIPYSLNSEDATVNGTKIFAGDPWSLEMWVGGWDSDALSFFVMGTVRIVLDLDLLNC